MARPASGRNVSRPVFCRFSIRKYSLGTCVGIISHSQTIPLYKNQTSLKWYIIKAQVPKYVGLATSEILEAAL
ncbi:YSIRK-type signal peptide-containing protein [Microcystis aeruginosa]|uniref:YSIRK-type signal peptide-containing protein n=1 Tax=Microcystis aeruginosa TaxID=1126 RepID=UPI000AD57E04